MGRWDPPPPPAQSARFCAGAAGGAQLPMMAPRKRLCAIWATVAAARSVNLTDHNFAEEMGFGRAVFIRHCHPKALYDYKHTCEDHYDNVWSVLMKEFADSEDVLVGDVKCEEQLELCANSVLGVGKTVRYPAIIMGSAHDQEVFQEDKYDLEYLKDVVRMLKPRCSPARLHLCDANMREKLQDLISLGYEKVRAELKDHTEALTKKKNELEGKLKAVEADIYNNANAYEREVEDLLDRGLRSMEAEWEYRQKTNLSVPMRWQAKVKSEVSSILKKHEVSEQLQESLLDQIVEIVNQERPKEKVCTNCLRDALEASEEAAAVRLKEKLEALDKGDKQRATSVVARKHFEQLERTGMLPASSDLDKMRMKFFLKIETEEEKVLREEAERELRQMQKNSRFASTTTTTTQKLTEEEEMEKMIREMEGFEAKSQAGKSKVSRAWQK